jgi:hypothetical protein
VFDAWLNAKRDDVTATLRKTMTIDDVIARQIAMCLIAGAAVG